MDGMRGCLPLILGKIAVQPPPAACAAGEHPPAVMNLVQPILVIAGDFLQPPPKSVPMPLWQQDGQSPILWVWQCPLSWWMAAAAVL